ncbi:hypothetical protein MCEREM21A_02236 [Sphingomonadaceae bacterium]
MRKELGSVLPSILLAMTATPAIACPGSGLDHVAVLVENTDTVLRSLNAAFDVSAFPDKMVMSDPGFGAIHLTYAELGGGWIEFVEPSGPGPMADMLKRVGSGAIIELNFEVTNLTACGSWLNERHVRMADVNGQSYALERFGSVVEPYGLRFAYVDPAHTSGATVEFFQRTPKADDFLRRRDAWLQALPNRPQITFGAVNVTVQDLNVSIGNFAKIGFPSREEPGFCKAGECRSALVDTGSMKIRLYQPLNGSKVPASRAAFDSPVSMSLSLKRALSDKLTNDRADLAGLAISKGGQESTDGGIGANSQAGLRLLLVSDK